MIDDNQVQQWLTDRGADAIEHPGGTLLDHLSRVADRLTTWATPDHVVMAGLCHAAYGTDGFVTALITPDERPQLVDLIGNQAEHLVYLYGSCVRNPLYPQLAGREPVTVIDRFTGDSHCLDDSDIRAFLEITVANEIDVMLHNEELARQHAQPLYELFSAASHRLPASARRDCVLLTELDRG
ncbi:DUF6817 domain-containing protein [Nocardia alba]|uniref:DUF6817 domain-containing protein n=1 Tax=Nocardia alba TaxID=225051 RepID=A0A4R1FZM4_9NOCA|nr:hypothetical protein [Nocardia alba]TCJ99284.1 hypothetical protein DFR71_0259 [Nocardia alba]